MKRIQLTSRNKPTKFFAIVDDEDFENLKQFNWVIVRHRQYLYAQRHVVIDGCKTVLRMHRQIMNTPRELFCDHKNHNGLDNRKKNLRNCTKAENQRNATSSRKGTSKYLGVCKAIIIDRRDKKRRSYWRAAIRHNKQYIYLGHFPFTKEGEIKAAKTYNKAAKKLHKEFSNLNKV